MSTYLISFVRIWRSEPAPLLVTVPPAYEADPRPYLTAHVRAYARPFMPAELRYEVDVDLDSQTGHIVTATPAGDFHVEQTAGVGTYDPVPGPPPPERAKTFLFDPERLRCDRTRHTWGPR